MLKRLPTTAICLVVLISGCASTPDWMPGRKTATLDTQNIEASEVSHYLRNMYRLSSGAPADQQRLIAELMTNAERSPTTTNRLALALARITAGHSATDIPTGRAVLNDMMADPALLVESERQLVGVLLNELDEHERIAGRSASQAQTELNDANRERARVASELNRSEAERQRLTRALQEAEEKLNAITRIERSIRERTDDEQNQ